MDYGNITKSRVLQAVEKSEAIFNDHSFLALPNEGEGGVLRRKFKSKPRAGNGISQVEQGISRIFRFQDVKHGILKFGGGNQHAGRNWGLRFKGWLDLQSRHNVRIDGCRRLEPFRQFRRIRRPEDSPFARRNFLPRCAVAKAESFERKLLLLIER